MYVFKIVQKSHLTLQVIEKDGKTGIDVTQTSMICASNVICNIIFGERFNVDDKRFKYLMGLIERNVKLNILVGPWSFFPSVRRVVGDFGGLKQVKSSIVEFRQFVQEEIERHEKTFDETDIRDFTDAFIQEARTMESHDVFSRKVPIYSFAIKK